MDRFSFIQSCLKKRKSQPSSFKRQSLRALSRRERKSTSLNDKYKDVRFVVLLQSTIVKVHYIFNRSRKEILIKVDQGQSDQAEPSTKEEEKEEK